MSLASNVSILLKVWNQLQKMLEDMSTMEAHQQFGKDLEPIIVSGSNRWKIFRVVDY